MKKIGLYSLILVAIIVFLAIALALSFKPTLISKLEGELSKNWGAQVNIHSPKLHFSPFGVSASKVSLTNHSKPEENLIQIQSLRTFLDIKALLINKIVINKLTAKQILVHEKRKKKGYVLDNKMEQFQSVFSKIDSSKENFTKQLNAAFKVLNEGLPYTDLIEGSELKKMLNELEEKTNASKTKWEASYKTEIKPQFERLRTDLKNLNWNNDDYTAIAQSLDAGLKWVDESKDFKTSLIELVQEAKKEQKELTTSISQIPQVLDKEFESWKSKLNLIPFNIETLADSLFGEDIIAAIQPLMPLMQLSKSRTLKNETESTTDSTKQKKEVSFIHQQVINVFSKIFPVRATWPDLWIKQVKFEVASNSALLNQLQGAILIENISSDINFLKEKPLIDLNLKGLGQNIPDILLKGLLKSEKDFRVELKTSDFPFLKKSLIQSEDISLKLLSSLMNIDATILVQNSNPTLFLKQAFKSAKWESLLKIKGLSSLQESLNTELENFSIDTQLDLTSKKMLIQSEFEQIFYSFLKKSFLDQIDVQLLKIKKDFDNKGLKPLEKLANLHNVNQTQILSMIQSPIKEIDSLTSSIETKINRAIKNEKRKQFKNIKDKVKKYF